MLYPTIWWDSLFFLNLYFFFWVSTMLRIFNPLQDGFPTIETPENMLANAFISHLQSRKSSPVILSILKWVALFGRLVLGNFNKNFTDSMYWLSFVFAETRRKQDKNSSNAWWMIKANWECRITNFCKQLVPKWGVERDARLSVYRFLLIRVVQYCQINVYVYDIFWVHPMYELCSNFMYWCNL